MSQRTERKYLEALAIVSKPRFYPTMSAAMESLPEFLRACFEDIAESFETVPHGDNIRAVLIDQKTWAEECGVPVYEAGYWIQRIANTCVRISIPEDPDDIPGYRPIMMIEHVQLDDEGQPNIVAVSVPTYGEVEP